jgi:hypothetical protein
MQNNPFFVGCDASQVGTVATLKSSHTDRTYRSLVTLGSLGSSPGRKRGLCQPKSDFRRSIKPLNITLL